MNSHEIYEEFPDYVDEFGLIGPLRADDGQRIVPPEGFYAGPQRGERLPDFALPSTTGGRLDLHADRGGSKAAVVFFRSAVW
ncbi:MAG: hypothetical protein V3V67_06930 [Myxococcota bacterium]